LRALDYAIIPSFCKAAFYVAFSRLDGDEFDFDHAKLITLTPAQNRCSVFFSLCALGIGGCQLNSMA
jgi:hypothetical protein